MNMEMKRAIILAARAAVRRGLPESANPFAMASEAHGVWLTFYRMNLSDDLRNDLNDSEYESSAY